METKHYLFVLLLISLGYSAKSQSISVVIPSRLSLTVSSANSATQEASASNKTIQVGRNTLWTLSIESESSEKKTTEDLFTSSDSQTKPLMKLNYQDVVAYNNLPTKSTSGFNIEPFLGEAGLPQSGSNTDTSTLDFTITAL